MSEEEGKPITTEAEAIAGLGAALTPARTDTDGAPYVVVPTGFKVESLEPILKRPTRHEGETHLHDMESFADYVNRFTGERNAAIIYCDQQASKFEAVLDEHGLYTPAWRRFRAIYMPRVSAEWKTWTGANKRSMQQIEFAQFIEDNLPDVVGPPAAEMLEISRTIEAKKKVNFASGTRLSNGQSELVYEETIDGTAGKGRLRIPETFAIGIAVFEGGPTYKVTARLRYRINDSAKLNMWFDLERPHKVAEDAFAQTRKEIENRVTVMVLNGTA